MGYVKYERFVGALKDLLNNHKENMLAYENKQTDDYRYTDITLQKVATCADALTPYFWAGFTLTYSLIDIKTEVPSDPIDSRYYLKTTPNKVSLMDDFLEKPFAEVWNLPEELEYGLAKALLADVIEEYQMCFQEFTIPSFEILFEQGYIDISQFNEKSRIKYYELYGMDSMLSKEAKDIFLF